MTSIQYSMGWRFLTIVLLLTPTILGQQPAPNVEVGLGPFRRAAALAPRRPESTEKTDRQLKALIKELGSDRFAIRESAQKKLRGMGQVARTALERATRHKDAEVAARAKSILDGLPELTHVVTDALGAPLSFVDVRLNLTQKTSKKALSETVHLISDDQGRIAVPRFPNEYQMSARLESTDFGQGRLNVPKPSGTLRFPVAKRETELYRRAVKGRVIGHDGQPIQNAVIQCRNVWTPGEGLISGVHPTGDVLTDSEGRFSLYLVNENRKGARGELIPLNSNYDLLITVPHDASQFPVTGRFLNGDPVKIEMGHAARFHRFRFEKVGGGLIEDPNLLRQMAVFTTNEQGGRKTILSLGPEASLHGRRLIAGTYNARGHIQGQSFNYQPLTVDEESPEELVFKLPPARVYRGRVEHGVSGKPISEAFVIGWSSTSRNNLALLSDEDWDLLRTAPSGANRDHPAVQRLRKFYGVQALARTTKDGAFEIRQRPDQEFYGLLAFDKDFVPFKIRQQYLKPDENNDFAAGTFPLYPAARVVVQPVFEGRSLSVSPRWLLAETGQPEWFDRFRKATNGSRREFEYVHWLRLNEMQPVYVPADIRLRLTFETPYNDEWAPFQFNEPIQLKQGETREIGDLTFATALAVAVRVVDKAGQPLEGVPVRRLYHNEGAWCVAHNTDAEGRAHFHVNPSSAGRFRVSDIRGPREVIMAENLFADFKVDKSAPEADYTIKLTDQQLKLLRGE